MGDTPVTIPLAVSKADLAEALSAAIHSRKGELFEEITLALRDKDSEFRTQVDSLLGRIDGVSSKVDGLTNKVDAAKTKVDDALEKLQERVNRKVNTYVVPAVTIAFIAVVLGIFAMLGGFKVIGDINTLKGNVETAQNTFDATSKTLGKLATNVNEAASKLATDRISSLEQKSKDQEAEIQRLKTATTSAKGQKGTDQNK